MNILKGKIDGDFDVKEEEEEEEEEDQLLIVVVKDNNLSRLVVTKLNFILT